MSVQVKKSSVPGAFSATAILPGEDPTAFKELHQNRGAAERRVHPMGEYKPFTYSATQWAAIRRELPSVPATASRQLWSTVGARRIPLIVGGGEVRPRDHKWARTMLERTARQFLAFEAASRSRHDAAAAERRACKEASRALRRATRENPGHGSRGGHHRQSRCRGANARHPLPRRTPRRREPGLAIRTTVVHLGTMRRRDAHEYARWPRCPPRRAVDPLFGGRLRPAVPGLQARSPEARRDARSPEARRDARSRSQAAEGAEAAAALTWQKRRRLSVRICHMTRAMVSASKQFRCVSGGVSCQFKSKNSMPPSSMGHFQRPPSYPARIRLHSRNCTRSS